MFRAATNLADRAWPRPSPTNQIRRQDAGVGTRWHAHAAPQPPRAEDIFARVIPVAMRSMPQSHVRRTTNCHDSIETELL